MNILTTLNFSIDGLNVTLEELIKTYTKSKPVKPLFGARAYATYAIDEKGHYFKHALWHNETKTEDGEIQVPGYFVPDVIASTYPELGVNVWQQCVREAMLRLGVGDLFEAFDAKATLDQFVIQIENQLGTGETKDDVMFADDDDSELEVETAANTKDENHILIELLGKNHFWTCTVCKNHTDYVHPRGIVLRRMHGQPEVLVRMHPSKRTTLWPDDSYSDDCVSLQKKYPDLLTALDQTQLLLPAVASCTLFWVEDMPVTYATPLYDADGNQWRAIDVNAQRGCAELLRRLPDGSAARRYVNSTNLSELFLRKPSDKNGLGLIDAYIASGLTVEKMPLRDDENPDGQWRSWTVIDVQKGTSRVVYRWCNQVQLERISSGEIRVTEHPDSTSVNVTYVDVPLQKIMLSVQAHDLRGDPQAPTFSGTVIATAENVHYCKAPTITPQTLMLEGRQVQPGAVLYDIKGEAHDVLEILDPTVYGAQLKLFVSEHSVGVSKYARLYDDAGKQNWFWESPVAEPEPERGPTFIHTDGGYYQVLAVAKSTNDKSRHVVYEHVWPFEAAVWTRPLSEWNSRFTRVADGCLSFDESKRESYQAEVSARKAKRKGAA